MFILLFFCVFSLCFFSYSSMVFATRYQLLFKNVFFWPFWGAKGLFGNLLCFSRLLKQILAYLVDFFGGLVTAGCL